MPTDTYFYGDPPFVIRKDNIKAAISALTSMQNAIGVAKEHLFDVSSLSKQSLVELLKKFSLLSYTDNHGNVWISGISKSGQAKGTGEIIKSLHCQKIFKAIGPLGEGVFSFIELYDTDYIKHRYEGDRYQKIHLNAAIYDNADTESIKKIAERFINLAIELGVEETEIESYLKEAVVNHVMSA